MRASALLLLAFAACLGATDTATGQAAITRSDGLSLDVSPVRDSIVFDLLGDLWTVSSSGGVAALLQGVDGDAAHPRWSPDGRQLAFQTEDALDSRIWRLDIEAGAVVPLGQPGLFDRHPTWHPAGDRVTYASAVDGTGFDLYEQDLATGLRWRLTRRAGDDIEPAWSYNGRDLAWVNRHPSGWSLVLRRFGLRDRVLVRSDRPLRGPSFRPDGTLLTYFQSTGDGYELRMVILSDPPLDRLLAEEAELQPVPVSWLDRNRYYYSAGGQIRSREFGDWNGRSVTFRATPDAPPPAPAFQVAARELPVVTPGKDALVIRSGRLFDGLSGSYLQGMDVRIENGLIVEIAARRDHGDAIVIDLPRTTLLPGFIDAAGRLPDGEYAATGASLLAWGITTIAARAADGFDAASWESRDTPGPRLLSIVDVEHEDDSTGAALAVVSADAPTDASTAQRVQSWQARGIPVLGSDWRVANALHTYLLPAADRRPAAPGRESGTRQDPGPMLAGRQLVSALAHGRVDGVAALFGLRQAATLRFNATPVRTPLFDDLRRSRAPIVAGTLLSSLPPGLALHAEFLALAASGLTPDQALRAGGRNAAALLGAYGQIGEITVGARADLVLVDGDPLTTMADSARIVAVIRNGRFYSLASLLERQGSSVE